MYTINQPRMNPKNKQIMKDGKIASLNDSKTAFVYNNERNTIAYYYNLEGDFIFNYSRFELDTNMIRDIINRKI